MKRWYALSAIGRDRPGIVADLAELIFECDCNLEDSSMTILGTEFAVLLLLTGRDGDTDRRLSSACKRLEWEKRLTVFFRPLEGEPVAYEAAHHTKPHRLQAVGVDKAGIVARVSRCLAEHGVNITEMQTRSRPEPLTGTSMFTMEMTVQVPDHVDAAALRRQLEETANDLRVDLTLEAVAGQDS